VATNLSFRTPSELMDKIKLRDFTNVQNPGATAKRGLIRWYDMLGCALREIHLIPKEAVVLIHLVNRVGPDISADRLAVYQIKDQGLGEAYTFVTESLAAKMASWPLATRYAAWDAAERYEALVSKEKLSYGSALHQVGLHTYDLTPEELEHVEALEAAYLDVAVSR
jgi:hypothetical protein